MALTPAAQWLIHFPFHIRLPFKFHFQSITTKVSKKTPFSISDKPAFSKIKEGLLLLQKPQLSWKVVEKLIDRGILATTEAACERSLHKRKGKTLHTATGICQKFSSLPGNENNWLDLWFSCIFPYHHTLPSADCLCYDAWWRLVQNIGNQTVICSHNFLIQCMNSFYEIRLLIFKKENDKNF